MPDNRYYYSEPIEKTVVLKESEHRHLTTVMRGKEGDKIEIINGKGVLAKGTISLISKRESEITIFEKKEEPLPKTSLILAQAITRSGHLDWIIEKATELGVAELWFFPGERSEKKIIKQERVEAIMVASIKQSGRLWIPKYKVLDPLKKWKKPEIAFIYGDPGSSKRIHSTPKESTILAIGPEAGWSQNEMQMLKKLGSGVCFHKNILRAETASIAGVALLYDHLFMT